MVKKRLLPILFIAIASMNCSQPVQLGSTMNSLPSSPMAQVPATPCPTPSPDSSRKIVVTAPCDRGKVAKRHFIEGVVSDLDATVWVIVHPMGVADYWVQPNVTIREGGRWKVLCYFGEPGEQQSGKRYEVLAVTNPKEKLTEGQLYSNWPETESKSQVIEVIGE